ncbi:MAG: hypothetical protein AB1813_03110 [Verrucomicrobiota bacterium]|jgi:cytochrome c-type biogenesis protein CcmH/NrfF
MFYIWFIPLVLILAVVVWLLYANATKKRRAGMKSRGETLVDER